MKKLTKKNIRINITETDDGGEEVGIILGTAFISSLLYLLWWGIIDTTIVLQDNRARNEAGYYCEYRHQGCSTASEWWRDSYDKEATIYLLKYKPCPCSKSGNHHIKWYKYKPVTIENNKKNYIK